MSPSPTPSELEAARLLLDRLGVSAADLLSPPDKRPTAPTFATYVETVSNAVGEGTRRVYHSYWNRIVEQRGDRHLDEPTPTEIQQLTEYIKANVDSSELCGR